MERISVMIRIRPPNAREARARAGGAALPPVPWRVSGESIAQLASDGKGGLGAPTPSGSFTFDRVFDQDAANADLYNAVARDIVASTFSGINGTIIAYGQTSSGKTHTMYGSDGEPGIVPRAIDAIFDALPTMSDRLFLLRVSMLEIYNDTVTDLLTRQTNLAIREDFAASRAAAADGSATSGHTPFCGRFVVKGLSEEVVRSREDVHRLMATGEAGRHVGGTGMNERSSRSHTVFQLTVESTSRAEHEAHRAALALAAAGGSGGGGEATGGVGAVRCAVLTLVDLAGSERQAKTNAAGARLKEGCAINQSLHHLSVVISKLTTAGADAGAHIPYRDSPLTKILQPALGGNARTALVCTVTLAEEHASETLSTLKFAALAKHVTNKAEVNEFLDDKSLIRRLRSEVARLRQQMARLDGGSAAEQHGALALADGRAGHDGAPASGERAGAEQPLSSPSGSGAQDPLQHVSDQLLRARTDLDAERAERERKEREYRTQLARIAELFWRGGGSGADAPAGGGAASAGAVAARRTTWAPGLTATVDPVDVRLAAETLPPQLARFEAHWGAESAGVDASDDAAPAASDARIAAAAAAGTIAFGRRGSDDAANGGGSKARELRAKLVAALAERDVAVARAEAAEEEARAARSEAARAAEAAEARVAAAEADASERLARAREEHAMALEESAEQLERARAAAAEREAAPPARTLLSPIAESPPAPRAAQPPAGAAACSDALCAALADADGDLAACATRALAREAGLRAQLGAALEASERALAQLARAEAARLAETAVAARAPAVPPAVGAPLAPAFTELLAAARTPAQSDADADVDADTASAETIELVHALRARDATIGQLRARCAQAERAALARSQQLHEVERKLSATAARLNAAEAQKLAPARSAADALPTNLSMPGTAPRAPLCALSRTTARERAATLEELAASPDPAALKTPSAPSAPSGGDKQQGKELPPPCLRPAQQGVEAGEKENGERGGYVQLA